MLCILIHTCPQKTLPRKNKHTWPNKLPISCSWLKAFPLAAGYIYRLRVPSSWPHCLTCLTLLHISRRRWRDRKEKSEQSVNALDKTADARCCWAPSSPADKWTTGRLPLFFIFGNGRRRQHAPFLPTQKWPPHAEQIGQSAPVPFSCCCVKWVQSKKRNEMELKE